MTFDKLKIAYVQRMKSPNLRMVSREQRLNEWNCLLEHELQIISVHFASLCMKLL